MGSLMAGWNSPVQDLRKVRRNRSLTKEEIEAYWRLKKKTEEEHLRAMSSLSDNIKESIQTEEPADSETETSNGWWTRSNWAFLNEPPVTESRASNYVSQFHVAHLAKLL